MNFCKYKNMFGEPKEGIHSYRIFDVAIMDVLQTVIVAFAISYVIKQSFWLVLLIMFLVGIVLHRLFCVRTTVDKLLFPDK